jgi:hypothetical protein
VQLVHVTPGGDFVFPGRCIGHYSLPLERLNLFPGGVALTAGAIRTVQALIPALGRAVGVLRGPFFKTELGPCSTLYRVKAIRT